MARLWAAPVAPSSWFSGSQLDRSRAYHRPLRTAALLRGAAQAAGLAVLVAVVRRADGSGNAVTAAIGAATAGALWLPSLAVDAWFEYRHRPRFGTTPIAASRFAIASVVTAVGVLTIAVGVALSVTRLAAATDWWPVVLFAAAAGWLVTVGPFVARSGHGGDPLPAESDRELAAIAEQCGVSGVEFGRLRSPDELGINAVVLASASAPRVLCSDLLLDAEPGLRRFVIAHELAHLRRRHHRMSLVVGLLGDAVVLAAMWAAAGALTRTGLAHGGAADVRMVPVLVAVAGTASLVTGLVEAWVSRAHERRADLDAARLVGVPDAVALRRLHTHEFGDLDPVAPARWWARHPPPAERLALLSSYLPAR